MKTIFKLLIAMLVLSFTACSTAPSSALKPNEKQVLGIWEEYSPGSNCVEFYQDHTMKIYLTKQEGSSMGGRHYIEADWTLDEQNLLTLTIAMGDKSFKQSAHVIFEKGEFWMKERNGTITKNRPVKAVPAKYQW